LAALGCFRQTFGHYTQEDLVRIRISNIENAAVAYKKRHGDYPPSLNDLIASDNGKPPALEESDLFDIWGNPFGYDPSQRHPHTGIPRIFTVAPEKYEISNW